ncbi:MULTISPECIES: YheC/YheD family protein [Spirulina sp. CCY15215]|uniref:ATP-grasp domain-containing protein n=1 Tax=Spirulina sp. CCY15215 TaxID=2767591 RepID=UPI00195204EC|nr:YheC/YheD family protein [Spirulina major]
MKILAICDPTRYDRPPLDVPTFYQYLAQKTEIDFFHIPSDRVFANPPESPLIQVTPVTGMLSYERFLELGNFADFPISLQEIDLIFCRTLKPFPSGYLRQLQNWEKFVKFVNSPTGKQEQIQADFLLKVAEAFIPDTIVTADWQEALEFFTKYNIIVAKQVNSCGGRGIFKIEYLEGKFQVDNFLTGVREFTLFSEVMNYLQQSQNDPLIFMRYLTRVDAGDKRIVVVDGEIYGAYIRRSASGHWINNVSKDGECFLAEITSEEKEAIAETVDAYRDRGLHTLGYDFLMDEAGKWRISEINAGNIGGFARLELLTSQPIMERLLTWLVKFAQRP